jgi:hypothetical protein
MLAAWAPIHGVGPLRARAQITPSRLPGCRSRRLRRGVGWVGDWSSRVGRHDNMMPALPMRPTASTRFQAGYLGPARASGHPWPTAARCATSPHYAMEQSARSQAGQEGLVECSRTNMVFVVFPLSVICAGRQVPTWTGPAYSAGRPGPASMAHSPAGPPRRAIPPEWAVGNGGGKAGSGWRGDGPWMVRTAR